MVFLLVFIFGAAIGSFLNCLVWRLRKKESMLGRSYCPKCRHEISWYDNIPLLSFIILRGKCRHCQKKISWQYPIVELITGLLFLISFYINYKLQITNYQLLFTFNLPAELEGFLLSTLKDWFIISVMIIIFVYDWRWYLILDIITLPAAAIIFIINLFLGISWINLLICAIIGGSFFLIQFLISKGKWIGGGDIRLGMLMGLCFGKISLLILSIMLAYFIGSVVGLGLIASGRKKWGSKVPLGVFLTTSTIISLLWGNKILTWYFGLIMF